MKTLIVSKEGITIPLNKIQDFCSAVLTTENIWYKYLELKKIDITKVILDVQTDNYDLLVFLGFEKTLVEEIVVNNLKGKIKTIVINEEK